MSELIPDEANVLYHSQRNAKGRAGRPVTSGIIWREILSGIWRYRAEGVKFRRDDIVTGPGGSQICLVDPSGNLVELFQPAK
jgi:hypothetical protein